MPARASYRHSDRAPYPLIQSLAAPSSLSAKSFTGQGIMNPSTLTLLLIHSLSEARANLSNANRNTHGIWTVSKPG
jgi:hypothetical protein